MDKCMNEYFLFGDEFKRSEEFGNYDMSVGKSLYEVIRVSEGLPIFLMEHLNRLENSADIMKYTMRVTRDQIINGIIMLIDKNKICNGNVKLVVNYDPNKGSGENNSLLNERFLIYFIPHSYPTEQQYNEGVKTITYHGERINPNAKVINSDFREKVNQQIANSGVYEAILVDDNGFITEGSKSNIFMVIGSTVVTSKVENVLPGITRQFIIKSCQNLNIDFQERNIYEKDIESLTGLFISGTSPEVLPIQCVDSFFFNSSKNSIINSIMVEYQRELDNNKQKFVKFLKNRTIN
ncbi:aminotransferase class IV [Clostridium bowmanii]|uniref:aminotransferase class IV n=1 Tax=Clostridium bowmanii TaxID=132925 RepID=UPI001C0B326F|nr:aminotransferase class IV [Clostridium bowmanii]MBU3190727.1 aminotransferase class IV [Clostridium bowmanii]MCA1075027.1 aminotransferase class IV [Clostridium bowmanii]